MRKAVRAAVTFTLLAVADLCVAADVNVETLLTELAHPSAVAIRPANTSESYEVFVAESGAGRVLKTSSSKPHGETDVITGLSLAADKSSQQRGGHPMLFLDERQLVVGIDGTPPGVRLFELQGSNMPLTADKATEDVAIEVESNADEASGRCTGLARTRANDVVPDMLLIGFVGDEGLNRVWKLPVRASMLSTLSPLGETSSVVAGMPTALAVSEQGYLLIAVDSADADKASLVFVNPANGQPVLSIETSLTEIFALAYSPKSGNLFALAVKDNATGLFRIDDAPMPAKPGVSETKLADIQRPTALAFGPNGALYVTSLGDQSEESKGGELLRLSGDF